MKDRALIADIHRIVRSAPRAGYRTMAKLLCREGWQINEKREHRIWSQEGLKGPSRGFRKGGEASFCEFRPEALSEPPQPGMGL